MYVILLETVLMLSACVFDITRKMTATLKQWTNIEVGGLIRSLHAKNNSTEMSGKHKEHEAGITLV